MTTQEKSKKIKSPVDTLLEMLDKDFMKMGLGKMVYKDKTGNSGVYIPKRKKPSSINKN